MGDSPAWTRDTQHFTSTRWTWRNEVTAITWWPFGEHSQDSTPSTSTDTKPASTPGKHTDWICPCGQNNWPWRRACYSCHVPKDMDNYHKNVELMGAAHVANDIEKLASGANQAATSSNSAVPADGTPSGKGK